MNIHLLTSLFSTFLMFFTVIENTAAKSIETKNTPIQNCQVISKEFVGKQNAEVVLNCKVPISDKITTMSPELPNALKKIEEQLDKQAEEKKGELASWRKQADVNALIGFVTGGISFVITIITIGVSIFLWWHRDIFIKLTGTKKAFESWKTLGLSLTEIQVSVLTEYTQLLAATSPPQSNPAIPGLFHDDPAIQANLFSLAVAQALQRLTAEEDSVVEDGCNYLRQVWGQLQQSKVKIKLYISELLSGNLVSSKLSENQLKTLLSELD